MRIKEQHQKAEVHAPASEEERDSEWPLPTELTRQRTGQSETQTNEKET
jgi:hypothetical protein